VACLPLPLGPIVIYSIRMVVGLLVLVAMLRPILLFFLLLEELKSLRVQSEFLDFDSEVVEHEGTFSNGFLSRFFVHKGDKSVEFLVFVVIFDEIGDFNFAEFFEQRSEFFFVIFSSDVKN
jgi:hypothetical protein